MTFIFISSILWIEEFFLVMEGVMVSDELPDIMCHKLDLPV
jgi:hypothetical protein